MSVPLRIKVWNIMIYECEKYHATVDVYVDIVPYQIDYGVRRTGLNLSELDIAGLVIIYR